jgi:calcineurin-like phosphoesterase family protein
MLFFTSDLHFGHDKIIKACRRPFSSIEEMNAKLIENWNATVGTHDEVYILGDFALRLDMPAIHGILEKLKGRKHLIFGNHDHEVARHRYFFRDVLASMRDLYLMRLPNYDKRLVLSHYPMMFWCGDYDPKFIHLYGHIHNNAHDMEWASHLRNAYNVGVDVNDYRPVSIEEILEKIRVNNDALPFDQSVNPPLEIRRILPKITVSKHDDPEG